MEFNEEFNTNFEFLKENYHSISHKDENYQRAKKFCREFSTKNFVPNLPNKIRYFWKNGNDYIKNIPLDLIETHCQGFFDNWFSRFNSDEIEFVNFFINNFRNKLTIPDDFTIYQTVEMLKIIKEHFNNELNKNNITHITISAIANHRNDVFDFIVENFKDLVDEKILAKNFTSPYFYKNENYSTIDIFMRLVNHFPNFFNYLEDHKINCDFLTLEFLTKYNLGRKVNLTDFYFEEEFLIEKKEILCLNEFVMNIWDKFYTGMINQKEYEIVRITIINNEYYPNFEQLKTIIETITRRRELIPRRRFERISEEERIYIEPFINRYPEDYREVIFRNLFIE